MRYDAILLDADDTIFDFPAAEVAALLDVMAHLSIEGEEPVADFRRINAACWRDFEKGLITQPQLRIQRFAQWLPLVGSGADPIEVGERYVDALARQGALLPGALSAVRAIAAARPIAIVTNGIGKVQRGRIARSPIAPLIGA
ncbi:MAG: hypothetical protein GX558_11640, partial [Clostridiales bacterium]|nr:hypothetical protein [Clostridiales bacterium]